MKKVGIVACSNGQNLEYKNQNDMLIEFLKEQNFEVKCSNHIYVKNSVFQGTPKERASELMKMFSDNEIEEIYDISGGDIANEILDELDFEIIKNSHATFWGYSDLTTIINAIYTMTGKSSVLYQVKNMVWGSYSEKQKERFLNREELLNPKITFLSKNKMEGVVVGGNIRCFLKLAGTKYFPDLNEKILLLEAFGGEVPQISTYLAQLKQLGAFEKVSGILLGTFTTMEKKGCSPTVYEMLKEYAKDLPVAYSHEIGHADNAKAIMIGEKVEIKG